MYSTFQILCQNKNCKNDNTVYLKGPPRIDKYYTITCPKCKTEISFTGKFALVIDYIPENAIEAELAD